jgi:Recombination endonuclease VII
MEDEMIQVGKKCNVIGCNKVSESGGLCGMHYMRQKRHGHLESTRASDWGSREKHELYGTYRHLTRTSKGDVLCLEWKNDFWQFVKDVGEKKKGHRFTRIDETKPFSKDNVYWSETIRNKDKNETMRAWREANPNYDLTRALRRYYGISFEDYDRMHKEQNSVCKICGKVETRINSRNKKPFSLAVDHCHATKKVRGLLCSYCNHGLGNFKDSIELLEKAIAYLKSYS